MRGFPRYRDRHEFPTACAPDMGPYRGPGPVHTLSFYRYTRKAGGNLGKGHLCLNVFPLSPQEVRCSFVAKAPDTAQPRIFSWQVSVAARRCAAGHVASFVARVVRLRGAVLNHRFTRARGCARAPAA